MNILQANPQENNSQYLPALLCWRWLVHTVLLAWLLATPAMAAANTIVQIKENRIESLPVWQWLEYYDNGLQNPDIGIIQQLPDNQWRNIRQMPAAMAFGQQQTLWFRFSIHNQDSSKQNVVVEEGNPLLENLAVYLQHGAETLLISPASDGTIMDKDNVRLLTLAPQSLSTVYIKSTGFQSVYIALSLHNESEYNHTIYYEKIFFGLLTGMMIGLTVYNLLLGLKTGQRMYFAYCLLGITNLVMIAIHQNMLMLLIPELGASSNNNAKVMAPLVITMCLVYFMQVFFETGKNRRKTHHFLNIYIVSIVVVMLAFFAGIPTIITTPLYCFMTLIASGVLFHLCLTNPQHRRSSMLLAASGLAVPLIAGIFTAMAASGNLSLRQPYLLSIYSAHVIEMLLFSLAMASRIRQLQDEHHLRVQAVTEARIISEAHNRLLAHLNHELRTPLNGILGAAEILLHKSPPRDRQLFNMIHHTALPLKHLVDDMVNIRAISENRKSVQNLRFDLQTLLQECMDIFLPTAHDKYIRLFFRIDQTVATDVTGDPHRLRQILLNLIGNACKFTRQGEVGVYVSLKNTAGSGNALYHFEVTDSGQGITQADQQRLFQSFETGPALSSQPGTGLGLSIVRELSELLGGSCGYGNNRLAGSTFWFTANLIPHQQVQRKTHQAFAGCSILLADESSIICEQLSAHIGTISEKIEIASSTDTLNNKLATTNYHLVIIHKHLLNDSTVRLLAQHAVLAAAYIDQSEALQTDKAAQDNRIEVLVRKTSIESFSLQIADFITRKGLATSKQPQPAAAAASLNVLVAEDIPTNQLIIKAMLESLSISPVMCSNGKIACDLYRQYMQSEQAFDLIIMDCEMPIMDGFEATHWIRNYERNYQLPPVTIVALTAHTEIPYRQRSEQAGMNSYLTKPLSLDSMRQCIASVEKRPR